MADLVMQEAYHVHEADNLALTQEHDLVVAEAYHLQLAQWSFNLVVAEAAHTSSVEQIVITMPNHGSTPWLGLDLPPLEVSSVPETRIYCPDLGLNLPVPTISARMAARMEGKLPTLEVSGTATAEIELSITATLPVPTISARSGITGGTNLRLPTLSASASSIYFSATMSRTLPGLLVTATGYKARLGSASLSLPPIDATGTGSRAGGEIGELSTSLPPIILLSATASAAKVGSMTGTLPTLEVDPDTGATGAYGEMESNLPALYFQTSGRDVDVSDDYIMRYVR